MNQNWTMDVNFRHDRLKKNHPEVFKMKRLIFQVAVGKPNKLYELCIKSVAEYCKKYQIEHIVLREPKLKIQPDINRTGRSKQAVSRLGYLPIYEKENAFEYLRTHDQVCIVDSDIYIKAIAPNIFDLLPFDCSFGGVIERQMPLTKKYFNKIRKYSRNAFKNLTDVNWKWNTNGAEFFNMGLMLMNKNISWYLKNETPKQFLSRPEFKDFVDGVGFYKWSTDQMLLNWWVKTEKMTVKHLDWKWNALYTAVEDNKLKEAYFVHFFLKDLLPNKGEEIESLLKKING